MALSLYYLPLPYFFIYLLFFLILLLFIFSSKSHKTRLLLINISILIVCLLVGELFFGGFFDYLLGKPQNILIRSGAFRSDYITKDDIRGYAMKKNCRVEDKLLNIQGEVIHDVIYSSDENGLRVIPKKNNPNAKLVVFFGCSFTFGESVNDNETLPYLFQEESKNQYIAYNFGFKGYGPHQMLRIIESGMIDNVLERKPDLVIYSCIIEHIERSAGNFPYILWDVDGPKYKLNQGNEPEFTGKFMPYSWIRTVYNQLHKSSMIDIILPKIIGHERNQDDIDLFIAIIKKSRDLLLAKYNSPFYVILFGEHWNGHKIKDFDVVLKALKENHINVIVTDDIFNQFNDDRKKYIVHENDPHPSPLAYKRVADYLLALF